MNNSNEAARETWDLYTASWKVKTIQEKLELFAQSLKKDCEYKDPTVNTKGWDELAQNMINFHEQVPGGHFVTTDFQTHSGRSMAKWDMCTGDGDKIGEGISFGQYHSDGKLFAMTGFY